MAIMLFDGRCLGQIQRFSLGYTFDNVHQYDIAQLFFGQALRSRRAYVASPYDTHFVIHKMLLKPGGLKKIQDIPISVY
jgi:hypothetical protein